jgi:tetratricopeptide (TPR) repeat protein
MYAAFEAPSLKRAVDLAMKALAISEDCADAYVFLAETIAETPEQAVELYRKGVKAGERVLGRKMFEEDAGHFWGLIETRPYMRALAGLAEGLWEIGEREEAVEHYWELLRLNPNDNQGIRDLLLPCLIELNRDLEAAKLHKKYKSDSMAVWNYSRALLDFRKHGRGPTAKSSIQTALNANRYAPSFLLGRKKAPRELPDYYGPGDENEAVYLTHRCLSAWQSTAGALEWLDSETSSPGKADPK